MKRALGVLLIFCLPFKAAGQNKQKQTYELIYQDVQLLKQQYQKLEKKIDDTSDDIKAIRDLIRDLAGQFKLFQADQARNQENLKSLPTQYQAFLERLGQIESQLLKVADQLLDLKSRPAPPVEQPQETPKKDEKTQISKKPKDAGKKVDPAPEKKEPAAKPPQTQLSHQEAYLIAYNDYQRGNYDLAIDGFTMYREQFQDPIDPLRDNALYMIGECYFSQKKFDRAIEQYDDLIVNYPNSDVHAASYYKKGLALAELKQKDQAIAVLTLLISKHPLEEDAKKAQQKIRELKEIK